MSKKSDRGEDRHHDGDTRGPERRRLPGGGGRAAARGGTCREAVPGQQYLSSGLALLRTDGVTSPPPSQSGTLVGVRQHHAPLSQIGHAGGGAAFTGLPLPMAGPPSERDRSPQRRDAVKLRSGPLGRLYAYYLIGASKNLFRRPPYHACT